MVFRHGNYPQMPNINCLKASSGSLAPSSKMRAQSRVHMVFITVSSLTNLVYEHQMIPRDLRSTTSPTDFSLSMEIGSLRIILELSRLSRVEQHDHLTGEIDYSVYLHGFTYR